MQSGQIGIATVPDSRFDGLVALYKPKKTVPAKIELFDTPGLSRTEQTVNSQRLGVIRESKALVQVIGAHSGSDPLADVSAFNDDVILADLQIVTNRIDKLNKDILKPRPDREALRGELASLEPIAAKLNDGHMLLDFEFNEDQEKAVKSFSLLSRKKRMIAINTADAAFDAAVVTKLEADGYNVVSAPFGLELELQSLPEEERAEFAADMGITESCRIRMLRAIFAVTEQITFFTSDEKEVHAWLLRRGGTAVEAADAIHSDLARGFIRADIMAVSDLLQLGSEREVKAAGLQHVEGKDYVMQDGDEIVVRSGV
jgi:ribosome-binding ATPase YchF (GTP1/OBG family)